MGILGDPSEKFYQEQVRRKISISSHILKRLWLTSELSSPYISRVSPVS